MEILSLTILFLITAIIVVPIFHRLNLGAVLGYLIAGILIGPSGMSLIWDPENVLHFSEFGVIFLMFVIGLELQPSRLWVLRKSVFGLGTAQLVLTSMIFTGLGIQMGWQWQTALVVGLGLSMSSTALVLQSLAERNQLTAQHGRDSFSILLFQDLAVIPLLALLPLLSTEAEQTFHWKDAMISLAVIVGFVVLGRLLLKPTFKWVASTKNRELFTAASLLTVMGTAALMERSGLSMGLGAFLAGVLLADSEYRHELEADIEPFKGLLLGLFFMAIGMSAKIELISESPGKILSMVFVLFFVKGLVLFGMKKFLKSATSPSRKLAVYLAQGGEFAFVIFAAAVAAKVIAPEISDLFVIVVTISMLIAPILFVLEDRYFSKKSEDSAQRDFDREYTETSVVIAGFGRFGQIVGRLLSIRKIPFTALDKSSQHVDFIRRFGNKIYYGDATRLDLLHAAKVGSAKLFVLAIDNVDDSLKTAELVRKHYPHVPIVARARNRFHSYKLLDLGITAFYRDTFFSSIEMGRHVLAQTGMQMNEIDHIIHEFKKYDMDLLYRQHAVYQDEAKLIQTSRQAMADLESLFESDSKEVGPKVKADPIS